MSQLEVDKIIPQSGTTLTIGETGDTISFASGVLPSLESLTVTGDLTVDTNTLFVDSTDNRVGIGTSSPQQKVHIKNTGTGSVRLRIENDEGFGEFSTDGDAVQLRNQTGIILNSVSAGDTQIRDGSASVKMTVTSSGTQFNDAIFLGGTGSANELDDYEEGTWIPIINPLSGTVTSSTVSGVYRKVGNLVTASFAANITGGTISLISSISGLPFTSAAGSLGVARENLITGLMWELLLGGGGTAVNMFTYNNSVSASNGYGWIGSITYTTS